MEKKAIKRIVIMGISLAILLALGIVYSLVFNDGRWVKEMYLPAYVFNVKDIPMIVIGFLIILYVIYIVVVCIKSTFIKKNK